MTNFNLEIRREKPTPSNNSWNIQKREFENVARQVRIIASEVYHAWIYLAVSTRVEKYWNGQTRTYTSECSVRWRNIGMLYL